MTDVHSLIGRPLRLIGAAALIGALATTTVAAQSVGCAGSLELQVANPVPGDQIPLGVYQMTGMAMDRAARQGSGVDAVQVFLGNRDEGGRLLADATLGQPSPAGWRADVDLSSLPTNTAQTLYVYAHSSVTDDEASVDLPVTVGIDRASYNAPPATGSCQASHVTVQVQNPAPGASLPASPFRMQGMARAENAPAGGSGIDAVQVFLGDRDEGGRLLANAQLNAAGAWTAEIDLSDVTGPQNLFVYAHSPQGDQEGSASVPVVVGG